MIFWQVLFIILNTSQICKNRLRDDRGCTGRCQVCTQHNTMMLWKVLWTRNKFFASTCIATVSPQILQKIQPLMVMRWLSLQRMTPRLGVTMVWQGRGSCIQVFWNCAVEHSMNTQAPCKMPWLHTKVFWQELLMVNVFLVQNIRTWCLFWTKSFFWRESSTCKPDEGEESKTGLRCEVLDERDANDNAPWKIEFLQNSGR